MIPIKIIRMSLIEAWDRQQECYIGEREARFDALLSAVQWLAEASVVERPKVVDLCCGPAAIGQRLLVRLPEARYVGIDIDPVLLALARQVAGTFGPDRMAIVECDVADARWLDAVEVGGVDVVCSSTALHWLSAEGLDLALAHAWRSLRPGGLLLNADHLGFDASPSFTSLAGWVARRDAAAALADGSMSWDAWWAAARSDADLGPLCARRDEVFPPVASATPIGAASDELEALKASADCRPALSGFVEAARRAGFTEVNTIWQRFDDRIVMAVKPESDDR
jgi:SAM-dependent methyltransferase